MTPTIYTIILLRHADSVGNAEGFLQGQSDFSMTVRGEEPFATLSYDPAEHSWVLESLNDRRHWGGENRDWRLGIRNWRFLVG